MNVKKQGFLTKAFIFVSISFLLAPILTGIANSADYPTKPIKVIISFGPGGGVDTTARSIAGEMEKYLKVPVVCENRPGGSGVIALEWLSRQKPDGYTIGMLPSSVVVGQFTGVLGLKVLDSFELISLLNTSDNAMAALKEAPYNNIKELADYARKNPGKIRISNNGTGSIWHLCAAGLEQVTGAEFTHVPFKDGKEAVVAMIGGHVEVSSSGIGEVGEFVNAGKAKILGLPSLERYPTLPDVPTFREQGYDLVMGGFGGMVAPKGIPKEILKNLEDACAQGVKSENFQTIQKGFGNKVYYLNSADFTRFVEVQSAAFEKAVKKLGLEKGK